MKRLRLAVPIWVFAVALSCSKSPPSTTASAPIPAPPTSTTMVTAPVSTPAATSTSQTSGLPQRLTSAEYWNLLSDISEPGGYFRIEDNYTSNEMEVGQLYTMLRTTGVNGDVYMGVGPEQNFTYIAAVRPRMAFIVD